MKLNEHPMSQQGAPWCFGLGLRLPEVMLALGAIPWEFKFNRRLG